MDNIVIRKAHPQDASVITQFMRAMVRAITAIGAEAPTRDDEKWLDIQSNITAAITHNERLYLLAEHGTDENRPVGFIEASIFSTLTVFEPRNVLHIHSLYVIDEQRHKGIATELMKYMLDLGKERGCTEAELDTIVANPARRLFEKLGFAVSEHNLRRTL